MTDPADLLARVIEAGRSAGLDHVGACDAEPFDDTRRVLEDRRSEGLDAGMQFTYRNPSRSTDPSATFPGVRSLVVGALGYAAPMPEAPRTPHGRVARYATKDHYSRLRAALGEIADLLGDAGHRARVVADENALVDRAAATRAGLGWYGKSANVLVPGHGSWFVLGSVMTDADLGPRPQPLADGCGSCRRCMDGCPTGAIIAPGVVDARRCLAWHVQQDGDLPHEFRVALSDRVYGCDDCQEVCPPSVREERRGPGSTRAPTAGELRSGHLSTGDLTTGPTARPAGSDPGEWVDLIWILTAADAELLERVGRWYVPRRDPRYLRRNALVALANSIVERSTASPDDEGVATLLESYLDCRDEMLATHAAWAAHRIGRDDLLEAPARRDREELRAERRRWSAPLDRRDDGRP